MPYKLAGGGHSAHVKGHPHRNSGDEHSLRQELAHLKVAKQNAEIQAASLQEELDQLRNSKLAQAEARIQEAMASPRSPGKLKKLRQEVNEAFKKCQEMAAERQEAEERTEALEYEVETLRKTLKENEATLKAANAKLHEFHELSHQVEKFRATEAELRETKSKLEIEEAQSSRLFSSLRSKLKVARAERQEVELALQGEIDDKKELQARYDELEQNNEELNRIVETVREQNERLLAGICELQDTGRKVEAENADLKTEVDCLRKENEDLTSDSNQVNAKIERLQKELATEEVTVCGVSLPRKTPTQDDDIITAIQKVRKLEEFLRNVQIGILTTENQRLCEERDHQKSLLEQGASRLEAVVNEHERELSEVRAEIDRQAALREDAIDALRVEHKEELDREMALRLAEEANRQGLLSEALSDIKKSHESQLQIERDKLEVEVESQVCSICCERMKDIVLVPCGHLFCLSCSREFPHNKCPDCRKRIERRQRFYK